MLVYLDLSKLDQQKLFTSAVILEQGNDLVHNLDIGEALALRFTNLFRVSAPLGDEVVDVEHGARSWAGLAFVVVA